MLRRRIPLVVSLALLTLSAACRNDTTAPPSTSLTGTWRQSGDLRDLAHNQSHIHLGTFTFAQAGTSFSGSGQQEGICHNAAGDYTGPLADPAPFPVSGGQVDETSVSFDAGICHYQGTFEHGNRNRITGTGTCHYTDQGVDYTFAGQWQADR
ncbi:MAG: hypothetical protein ABJD11_08315 [Gemmatimonadota bacterium]